MPKTDTRFLVCSCENTMPLDAGRLSRALDDAAVTACTMLCRDEIARFTAAAAEPGRLIVACTQEAPLFAEAAEAQQGRATLGFTNIRERAGWSDEGRSAAPKMAALLAEATVEPKPTAALPVRSDGRVLVFGRPEVAFAAARQLAGRMAVTCVLEGFGDVTPAPVADMALFVGRPAGASGHVGAFSLRFADVLAPRPSSRDRLEPATRKDSVTFEADVILDLSSAAPLFPGRPPRDGYVRVDAGDPVAVQKAVFEVADLVGEFEKPRYIVVDTDLCAHSRSTITGCTRCLDACPTGALTPAGDHVAVDALACGGHGACNSVCPTGAIKYQVPQARDLLERLRVLLGTYEAAGGTTPVLLVHDRRGDEAIALLARHGRGLPAHVLPFAVNEVGAVGLDLLLTALAMGAARVVLLATPEMRGTLDHLDAGLDLAGRVMEGLGYGAGRVELAWVTDPDAFADHLRRPVTAGARHAGYMALGERREIFAVALDHLHACAPAPVDELPLPAGAPFGTLQVDVDGCTLCLSCVGACPVAALGDNPERPQLTFLESACVQCGLCAATCPEKVITLQPRINFATGTQRRVVKEEEPFACVCCGKEFGTKSAIDRIVAQLSGHSMFGSPERLRLLQMCADCRVIEQVKASEGSALAPPPPRPRTTDDYLREREEQARKP
ncbi:4Fe-4S binding protein [Caenispirillum bisanense]|uniref:4Fe-4S binding protein n=1 Tax=Caenispirillum bisanense TaxID=414052 RepID=UPI0031DE59D6